MRPTWTDSELEGWKKRPSTGGGVLSSTQRTSKGPSEVGLTSFALAKPSFPKGLMKSWKDAMTWDLDSNPNPVACCLGP